MPQSVFAQHGISRRDRFVIRRRRREIARLFRQPRQQIIVIVQFVNLLIGFFERFEFADSGLILTIFGRRFYFAMNFVEVLRESVLQSKDKKTQNK